MKWKIKKSIQISRLRKYVETYEMKINQLQEQIVSKERQLEQNVSLIKLYGPWWVTVRIALETGLTGLMRLYQLGFTIDFLFYISKKIHILPSGFQIYTWSVWTPVRVRGWISSSVCPSVKIDVGNHDDFLLRIY